MTNVKGK